MGEKERERKWLLVSAKGGTIFHKRRKQAAERVTATETVGSVGGEKPTGESRATVIPPGESTGIKSK